MEKMKIDIEALAAKCGVEFIACEPKWGGKHAFKTGKSSTCGFKTRKAAAKGWFERQFRGVLGEILLRDYLEPVYNGDNPR